MDSQPCKCHLQLHSLLKLWIETQQSSESFQPRLHKASSATPPSCSLLDLGNSEELGEIPNLPFQPSPWLLELATT